MNSVWFFVFSVLKATDYQHSINTKHKKYLSQYSSICYSYYNKQLNGKRFKKPFGLR